MMPFTRAWEIRSLAIDAQLCDRLEDAGFLYQETTECQSAGRPCAVDIYRGLHRDTWVFHVHMAELSYLFITVQLPVDDQDQLELAMSFLAVGLCRGVPADLPNDTINLIEGLVPGPRLLVA